MAQIQSNFNSFKDQFKKDTGLDWNENLDKYLLYYQARVQDTMMQVINIRLSDLLTKLEMVNKGL